MIKLAVLMATLAVLSCLVTCDAKKFNITVNYESYCPDSSEFFLKHLRPTYLKLNFFLNYELIPFGKAKILENGTMECQHGPKECDRNRLMACVQKHGQTMKRALLTISCIFNLGKEELCVRRCLEDIVSWETISECSKSDESMEMMRKFAEKSKDIDYVPWIALYGKHDDEIQKNIEHNMLKYICDQLEEAHLPECQTKVEQIKPFL